MGNNLLEFVKYYDKFGDGKKSVNDCIEQLSVFASKGLQVESALAPLQSQLKGLEDLQNDYLNRLIKINQEFDQVIKDMSNVADLDSFK